MRRVALNWREVSRQHLMNLLADELLEHDLATGDQGGDISEAAKALGMPAGEARKLFAQMQWKLGAQAS